MWIIFALLSALTAALVAIFGKVGLEKIDPGFATFVRSLFMAGFLFLLSLFRGQMSLFKNIDGKELIFIVLAGFSGALSWLFYFWALKYAPAVKVATIDRLSLVFILILAAIFLGDKITFWALMGVALIIIGSVVVTVFSR